MFLVSRSFFILLAISIYFPCTVSEDSCSCGVKQSERIVNGKPASANEYPWMAAMIPANGGGIFCGASIISNSWILTAAHCFKYLTKPSEINVIVGDHDLTSIYPESYFEVEQIILHPEYDEPTINNDIAVLKLKNPLTFGDGIASVCLPFDVTVEQFIGQELHTIGWGKLSEGGFGTFELQELPIPIITDAECEKTYGAGLTDKMFCAYKSGSDTCQGDSGGPTTVEVSGKHIQLGIVSFGAGCARHGKPGVYTNLPVFMDWIQQETSETFCRADVQPDSTSSTDEESSGSTTEDYTDDSIYFYYFYIY